MNSHYWWTLRRWWHHPHHMAMAAKPDGPKMIWYRFTLIAHRNKLRGLKFLFGYGMRQFFYWLWWQRWAVLNTQPFRCNGNKGGWQTKFCEWLEEKARDAEDRED